ncbi:MAG: hypothetical protein QM724_07680 [Flavobacteriales bacterium]
MAERVLRVGILCNGTVFQRWQAECIRQVAAVPGVQLAVLVVNAATNEPSPGWPARLMRYPWRTLLYRQYRKRWGKPAAMAEEDLNDLLEHVPRVMCRTVRKKHAETFTPADLKAIEAHAPDVLLRFGFNILHGPILELPRHGVWSYHHGDEEHYRGGPPGLWEILDDEPVIGTILQRLTERLDAGLVLRKGWFGVVDHSLTATLDRVLMHSSGWAAQICRQLLNGDTRVAMGTPSHTHAPVLKYPRNTTFLRFLHKQFNNKMRFHRRELKEHEEWNLGILHQPIHTLLQERPNLNVRWLPAPGKGQYRADPFGYTREEQLVLFYEKYDYAHGRGIISRLRPRPDNILKRSRTMLDEGDHLSYPFVVEREGSVYVIPEQASTGRVDLYRVTDDNESFERMTTLLHEPLLDPTLVEHGGRWWLFGTKAPLTNEELFIYHSDRFEGPYVPHTLNPVKTDIRSARPAGTPFRHEGTLYRPAQDSSLTYGGRVAINRIITLTPDTFQEEVVRHVGPLKGTAWSKGLHTVSAVGGSTLIDGKRFVTDTSQERRIRQRKIARLAGRNEPKDEDRC